MSESDEIEPETSDSDPKQPPALEGGLPWLAFGLFLFGVVNGVPTGLSETAGTAQTLLTSLSTFVGGALLTYAGFVRPTSITQEKPQLDPRRVGVGLSCFSIGVLGGLALGIALRAGTAQETDAGEVAPRSPLAVHTKSRASGDVDEREAVKTECRRIFELRINDYPDMSEDDRKYAEDYWDEHCEKAGRR